MPLTLNETLSQKFEYKKAGLFPSKGKVTISP